MGVRFFNKPEVNPLDGWHGNVHLHAPPVLGRVDEAPTFEHFPNLKYWPRKKRRVLASCCNCYMDPSETVTSGFFQEWYGWSFADKCAPDKGCNANPRRRLGMHLREPA